MLYDYLNRATPGYVRTHFTKTERPDGENAPLVYPFKWYKLAAEQDNNGGQGAVGVMYREAIGVIQDYARAYMWFDIAASQEPDGIAKQFRSKVENLMTPTQIAGAKNLALECKVKNYKGW